MPFLNKGTTVSTVGCHDWKTEEHVRFLEEKDDGTEVLHVVPPGFQTDFASVPRMVQWLFPAYGLYTLAAIVHDWYCVLLAKAKRRGTIAPITSRENDRLFRVMMKDLGVPLIRRWVMWDGVRWGALFSKNGARRDGIVKDLPLMIFWAVVSAPVVLPISVVVGIGLIIDYAVNKIAGLFCP